MLELEDDLANFLKDLHNARMNTIAEDVQKEAKESSHQKLFYGTVDPNFNIEVENGNLELEKAECERLKEAIGQSTEELNTAEKLLDKLHTEKEMWKGDLKTVCDKLSTLKTHLDSVKRMQKPGSHDRRRLSLQRSSLKIYETLFKMKIQDPSVVQDKPKNLVNGFIYNRENNFYVKYFTLPLVRGIGFDLLRPAAQLAWSFDEEDDTGTIMQH